jgi:hypothetical protein
MAQVGYKALESWGLEEGDRKYRPIANPGLSCGLLNCRQDQYWLQACFREVFFIVIVCNIEERAPCFLQLRQVR